MIKRNLIISTLFATSVTLVGCGGSDSSDNTPATQQPGENATSINPFTVIQGTDLNRKTSALLSLNPGGPGGSPNQSLRAGDILSAQADTNSILIGGLGVDVLLGNSGNDILIGGTEDFNSSVDGDNAGADNRDRAFGQDGEDVFIWSPGDGSDFFDGGPGTDVLIFGLLGENKDSNGDTNGAPFFNVNPPNREGSQDFDGIALNDNNLPIVDVSNSPGFCSVLSAFDHPDEFALLNLDHIVRFSLRGIANDFDAGVRTDDDGLRVAISARNVEYVVCTGRESGIEVLDLSTNPATLVDISQLPEYVVSLIQ
ncbi:hemolysin-type calcium-binding repeat-containing protein [Oleiphilus messinensis]|uniref:Hemolysin-type calcium-binding repeat-containing protein n=2 Tax=Oleiphilus messinensis TaxID=141451 RepID=A0A1Y0ICU0_9GAMM|nr:hemolysin-type calcium-binding repeat-containing protein [Oleiphilus messinensis]